MIEIDRLQQQWNKALGVPEHEGFYNYHPVLSRSKFERHQQSGGDIWRFKLAENQNVTTSLRERDHTQESRLKFVIEGNKIKAEFEDEPHEVTIIRGRDYRKSHGSNEIEREAAEVEGFQVVQSVLTAKETPVGTTFLVISGPGLVKDTQYEDNFADFYELREDEFGRRYVQYTRFSSALDYEEYKEVAKILLPNYFDTYKKGDSIDAYLLGHPILMLQRSGEPDEIFSQYFEKDPKAMEERIFLERLRIYQPYIQHYLNILTKPEFDPIEIAKSINLMYLSPDNRQIQTLDLKDVAHFVSRFGWMQPAKVMAGCGLSAGFKIGGENSFFSNSVGKFGFTNQIEEYTGENAKKDPRLCKCGGQEPHFHCDGKTKKGTCGHAIEVGKGISKCPSCGEGKKC